MSTFSLDEDQRQIKESMESFAADELRPISRDCDEKFEIPPEFLEKHGGWDLLPISYLKSMAAMDLTDHA